MGSLVQVFEDARHEIWALEISKYSEIKTAQ